MNSTYVELDQANDYGFNRSASAADASAAIPVINVAAPAPMKTPEQIERDRKSADFERGRAIAKSFRR